MQCTTLKRVWTHLLLRWAARVLFSRYIIMKRTNRIDARMKEPTAIVPKWYCITRPYARHSGKVSLNFSSPRDQYQRQKAPAIVVKEIALMSPTVHITMKMLKIWKTGCKSRGEKAFVSTIVALLNREGLVKFPSDVKASASTWCALTAPMLPMNIEV